MKKIDFAVGGQALIEGVMMKSPSYVSMAVRKKDGSVKLDFFRFVSLAKRNRFLGLPIIRGIVNLFEMLVVGMRALNFSANEYAEDDEKSEPKKEKSGWQDLSIIFLSLLLSLALAVFLFKYIPLATTEFLRAKFPFIADHYIVFNLIDGSIRILIFILYILALSASKSFGRIFRYHGAEHKSIFAYEKFLDLTPLNARLQMRFHPRCGTSFIIIVFLISIIIYTFVPRNPIFWLNLLQRIAIIPLIAGIGYEILKWSAKHTENLIVKILVAPGLWSQRITTKEPDGKQLEVALIALKKALELEKSQF